MIFQPTGITPPDKIFTACKEIQDFLEAHYPADIESAVVGRAQQLEVYMALSGKMLADAKHHVETLLNSTFLNAIQEAEKVRMSPSTLNKYLDSLTKDYNYLVNWCERINRACTHGVEFSRTIISKLKQEAYNARYSQNT
jgi:hypothetical protein